MLAGCRIDDRGLARARADIRALAAALAGPERNQGAVAIDEFGFRQFDLQLAVHRRNVAEDDTAMFLTLLVSLLAPKEKCCFCAAAAITARAIGRRSAS